MKQGIGTASEDAEPGIRNMKKMFWLFGTFSRMKKKQERGNALTTILGLVLR